MAATVKTTFTFSSTDIASDTLSFSVSETLNLTGSGGIERVDLAMASGSGSSYRIYNENDFGSSTRIEPRPSRIEFYLSHAPCPHCSRNFQPLWYAPWCPSEPFVYGNDGVVQMQ